MTTRQRAKGRRGGEGERFAYLPESVLQSEAVKTLPHAAFKVLCVLCVGRSRERNGTSCCSDSYALKYGISSRHTVRRSLEELQERGLITVTRRVSPFRKHPTLYGMTWWPIWHRDGQPLSVPEPPSHAYLNWTPSTPAMGAENAAGNKESSHPSRHSLTPVVGVEKGTHHTHGDTEAPIHHTHGGCKSLDIGVGARTSNGHKRPVSTHSGPRASITTKIRKLIASAPHLTDREVAHTLRQYGITAEQVAAVRREMGLA